MLLVVHWHILIVFKMILIYFNKRSFQYKFKFEISMNGGKQLTNSPLKKYNNGAGIVNSTY